MAAIDAPALNTAKAEIFSSYPNHKGYVMNKGKKEYVTGIGGDDAHQKRKSDHNQGNAIDIHHEPGAGTSGDKIAAIAIRDPRVKYVIWNRRIYTPGQGWKPYKKWKSMPHDTHVHISIKPAARGDTSPWNWKQNAPSINKPGETKFEDSDPKNLQTPAKVPIPRPRPKTAPQKSASAETSGKGGRYRLVQGYHGVMLASSQNMAAHVDTPHTGGGQVNKASRTVFIGPQKKGFARIGDPTNDGYNVVEGVSHILVG